MSKLLAANVALMVSLAAPPAARAQSCPAGAITGPIHDGETLQVAGIHPEDAYHGSSTLRVGDTITTTGHLNNNGGCWFGGPAVHSDGTTLYFFKTAFRRTGSRADAAACPAGAITSRIRSGQTFQVVGIHPADAYHGGDILHVGDRITAADLELHDGCWFSGPAVLGDGTSLYFYKVALGFPSEKGAGKGTLPDRIRGITNDDAIDDAIERLLLDRYDHDRSGAIDTTNELDAIGCDVLVAIDTRYRKKWGGASVRQILGFAPDYIWVGHAIGLTENLRRPADRRMEACGIRL